MYRIVGSRFYYFCDSKGHSVIRTAGIFSSEKNYAANFFRCVIMFCFFVLIFCLNFFVIE